MVKRNPTFIVNGEKFKRGPGETFSAAMNVVHSLVNDTTEDVVMITEMRPAADMAKMMAVIAGLQDDKESNWLFKFFYVERRAGLKEFSTPTALPVKIMTALLMPVTMLIGRLANWDRFIDKYI